MQKGQCIFTSIALLFYFACRRRVLAQEVEFGLEPYAPCPIINREIFPADKALP
jgi:hypothetical protein